MHISEMATKSSWDDLTYPKKEGGLGLFKICEWNRAAILRLIWSFLLELVHLGLLGWMVTYWRGGLCGLGIYLQIVTGAIEKSYNLERWQGNW